MSGTDSNEPCHVLAWDSAFWGFQVARVHADTLTPERAASIDGWCRERSIACLYFLASFDDPTTVRCAESANFRLVDCRVVSAMGTAPLRPQLVEPSGVVLRDVLESDVEALRQMAADSYQTSRFYFDQSFPRDGCRRLYQHWIVESCRGFADHVIVAHLDGEPAGYVTCHLPTDEPDGRIGLIEVSRHARGRGIGRLLMEQAREWFARQQVQRMVIVTQARNVAVQALNARCGLVPFSFRLWYHKWFHVPQAVEP